MKKVLEKTQCNHNRRCRYGPVHLFGINRSLGGKNLQVADCFNVGVYSKQQGYT